MEVHTYLYFTLLLGFGNLIEQSIKHAHFATIFVSYKGMVMSGYCLVKGDKLCILRGLIREQLIREACARGLLRYFGKKLKKLFSLR